MTSATQLSLNDSAVLGALFDPEASLSGTSGITIKAKFNHGYDKSTTELIQHTERQALLPINTENPTSPEIQFSIAKLDELITRYPKYASAYNNRAQARRLLIELDHTSVNMSEHYSLIIDDLAEAIKIASPIHQHDAVSPEQANILSSAYTHRGFLLYKASRSSTSRAMLAGVKTLQKLDSSTLEEMASGDFSAGGRYGNALAKQMAVQTNPYAKLCGSIVKEALKKEMESHVSANHTAA